MRTVAEEPRTDDGILAEPFAHRVDRCRDPIATLGLVEEGELLGIRQGDRGQPDEPDSAFVRQRPSQQLEGGPYSGSLSRVWRGSGAWRVRVSNPS